MRIQKHKDDCCGCTACASICPRQAITMKPDSLGDSIGESVPL